MSQKVIVVFAATGKSGGGMIDYILKDGTFAARAVTRNPEGASAKGVKTHYIVRVATWTYYYLYSPY